MLGFLSLCRSAGLGMCLAISLPVHGKGPLPSCAHHMGHFIYIAGSTHLYLVRLRGHPRLELKKGWKKNVWSLRRREMSEKWVRRLSLLGCVAINAGMSCCKQTARSWVHLWMWTPVRFRPFFKHCHLNMTWLCFFKTQFSLVHPVL